MRLKAILSLVVVAAVLGVILMVVSKQQPSEPVEPRPYVWDFEMEDLTHIQINLPKIDQSQSWVKHEDRYFYFDIPNGPKVDMGRWGGGIPLILSGPGAERRLFIDAPDSKLKELGFNEPAIVIKLTLVDGQVYDIEVADPTPSGLAYYIRMAGTRDIYTVDSSWYDVILKLVTEPPWQPAKIFVDKITVTPAEPASGQTVTVTAEVVNNGTLAGAYEVKLKVNGVVEATRTVELQRDERKTVVFTTKGDKPGVYSVNVEGQTGKFTIR